MEAEHLIGCLPFVVKEYVFRDGTFRRFHLILPGDGIYILFR